MRMEFSLPMLSIIIPTLNEEKYLPLLLKSIQAQEFGDYEIIVADAASKDKTVEIARNFGCKVIAGGLPAKGRNEGAKVAKGELLLFLDADVVLPKGFLKEFLEKFKNKKLDIASCGLQATERGIIYRLGEKLWNLYFKLNQYFFPCAGSFCILVKKKLHQKLRGFDETIRVGEDFDYVRRVKKMGKFHFFLSPSFLISARRFEEEGLVRTLFKYLAIEFQQIFFGPIRKDFNYNFNHYSKKKRDKIK